MCIFDELKNKYFAAIDFVIILIIGVVHLVFFFFIKETDFENIFDAFESSPLFEFSIETKCGSNSHVIFHTWEGRKTVVYSTSGGRIRARTKIVDPTDISKINGHYFCYKHISYKELLYNGQIIKKGAICPQEYQQNCGIIDTLEQELCIKNEDKCPLYDVGIGQNTDTTNYESRREYEGNFYYNKENFDVPNKKIIGKLILNEGQPCYRLNEKKWRTFVSEEAGEENFECKLEIFGKLEDGRYHYQGNITYDKLYNDNLGSNYNIFKDKIEELQNYKVSLYKREFLGIDKSCDEKSPLSDEKIEKLNKSQEMEVICLLVELLIMISFFIAVIVAFIKYKCTWYLGRANFEIFFLISVFICLVAILVCIICHSVFLARMINNDVSYECSDKITNEVLRKEKESTHNVIIYTIINLSSDIFAIILNLFFFVLSFFGSKYNREELLLLKI